MPAPRDDPPRSSVMRSPVFWGALVMVVVINGICAWLWFGLPADSSNPYRQVFSWVGIIGLAAAQLGALAVSRLRIRQNRPLGLGLLVGLLLFDGVPIIIAIVLAVLIMLAGGLKNF